MRNRTALFTLFVFLASTFALNSATASCPQDVVGTTILQPTLQFLPDGVVTADFANPVWYEDDTVACYYSYQNPAYLFYFPGCDYDGSGIVEAAELLDVYYYAISTGGISTPCPGGPSCPAGIPTFYDQTATAVDWTAGGTCVEAAGISGPPACPQSDWQHHVDSIDYVLGAYPWTNAVYDHTYGSGQMFANDPALIMCSGFPMEPASEHIFDELNACYRAQPRCLFDCNFVWMDFDWNVNVWALLSEYDDVAAQHGGWCEIDAIYGGSPTGFHAADAGGGWLGWTITADEDCQFGGCDCSARLTMWSTPTQPGVYYEDNVANYSTGACTDPRFNF